MINNNEVVVSAWRLGYTGCMQELKVSKTSWKILPPSWMQDADLRMQISI